MPQEQVFYFFIVLAVVIAIVFVAVGWSTRQAREVHSGPAYKLRKLFFVGLSVVFLGLLAVTLPRTPYSAEIASPDRIVHVVGKQFAFALSESPISTEKEWEEGTYSAPVEVPAGTSVEFRVTSLDVNHSFGLYSPGHHLIAQTQAMPGYVNRLRVRLDEPGRYAVLCLEMCGMDHHKMRAVMDVK